MTNISNQETADKGVEFRPGNAVVIKTQLEFVDRAIDSDQIFIVLKVKDSGITILSDGLQLTVAESEIRPATQTEREDKKRLNKEAL
ncbi:hypothetical protein F909_03599 [Acinetobacter sp. ANC 3929]|uniref:hypothetical protein n=1 Tax=Acinetobacter sp. ANC 3929 TaxID=1217707 RepID=UPI0002CEC14F|nr:hypothetical protein [Acinetobacter sp. ANC 3929]ENW78637.1 hypothetical protein F909_03599 [Acinetobacter sp. ANC 3929]